MRDTRLIAGIVAATLVLPAVGWAQKAADEPLPPTENAPETAPEAAPAPEPEAAAKPKLSDAEARAAHLDTLFERLADPEAGDWQRIAGQIWATWNRSGSDSMDLLANRADKAIESKDYAAALVHLNDLTRLAPGFAEGWNKRATLHFIRGDYGPSLEDIAKTLELEPRHFGALSGLGIILDRIGDEEGALEAYRRAARIHPNLPGARDGIKKLEKEVEGERL